MLQFVPLWFIFIAMAKARQGSSSVSLSCYGNVAVVVAVVVPVAVSVTVVVSRTCIWYQVLRIRYMCHVIGHVYGICKYNDVIGI